MTYRESLRRLCGSAESARSALDIQVLQRPFAPFDSQDTVLHHGPSLEVKVADKNVVHPSSHSQVDSIRYWRERQARRGGWTRLQGNPSRSAFSSRRADRSSRGCRRAAGVRARQRDVAILFVIDGHYRDNAQSTKGSLTQCVTGRDSAGPRSPVPVCSYPVLPFKLHLCL